MPARKLPRVVRSSSELLATQRARAAQGQILGLVPTMGALHDGHTALIEEARHRADHLVVSIFVNPLQFDRKGDLRAYPRTFEGDLERCAVAGVDTVFAPTVDDMYPDGFDTRLVAGELGRDFEGAGRPGHFDGVLTVCLKLFVLSQAHFAVFGEKDFQQLCLIRRLVRDLGLPLEIVPVPVLRDTDGLALSSRNVHLGKKLRERALCLYQALCTAQDLAADGERNAGRIQRAAQAVLDAAPSFRTSYCAVVDPSSLQPLDLLVPGQLARLLIAGHIGARPGVRLLDNGPLFVGRT